MNDLDWADRETVLRLLFSKMNTGDQAANWRDNAPSVTGSRSSKQQNSELNKAQEGDDYIEEYYDEEGTGTGVGGPEDEEPESSQQNQGDDGQYQAL